MELFGVTFAPWNIPLERRLQTLAVLFWSSLLIIFGILGPLVYAYILLFTNYYWLVFLYAIWYWYDSKQPQRGGRRWKWVRNLRFWKYMSNYFPVKLIKTADFDLKKNYICGYHPHGIIAIGAVCSFGSEAVNFSNIFNKFKPHLLTMNIQFKFPIYRDILLGLGVCSVSKESICWILKHCGFGNIVVIVIGGAKEALDAHPGIIKLTLRKRKGFVREALINGASLVPMFGFGENELYDQIPNPKGSLLRRFQDLWCRFVGFSPPLFHGRGVFQYNFGFLPYRNPISVVVGKPIDVEHIPNPTAEEISRYHDLYMQKLLELFEEHKKNYEFYKEAVMEFI